MWFSTLSRGRRRPQGLLCRPPRPVNFYNICGPDCFGWCGGVWGESLDRYHKHDSDTAHGHGHGHGQRRANAVSPYETTQNLHDIHDSHGLGHGLGLGHGKRSRSRSRPRSRSPPRSPPRIITPFRVDNSVCLV